MRIAVIGAGGIGAYYGAKFQQASHDVTFVARGAQLQAVDMPRLCAASPTDYDLPILAVKAGATAEIAVALKAWFGPGGGPAVLSL
ncbi:2-dehydropantoate 2-reductase N-terminal domain-containing protein [Marinobacter algicola]|uniref:2-dehydropantoate 2-reductase N-terminal domain-containing protein n=1 Tax=Marinobacter algicola TaxID=236100 RepID=UPI003BA897E8